MKSSSLESQISDARQTISAEAYPMSIGELTNLYKEGELIIRPEFQRFYRWTALQKSRLIESIFLGIPLPSLFVAQTDGGQWELIDGLQRMSTILEVQGELKNMDGVKLPPLELVPTKYLAALGGKSWNARAEENRITDAQKLDLKRSRLDLKIINRGSSPKAKYDLFQRLNAYGAQLTAQEMRSALLVAASPEFFSWVEKLSRNAGFMETTALSERLIEERYDVELVLRFLVLHDRPQAKLTNSALREFSQRLDDESVALAERYPRGSQKLERVFVKTFEFIKENGGENVFRKWEPEQKVFKGAFLNTSFEIFALGVGFHTSAGSRMKQDLMRVVKDFWARPEMKSGFSTGRSTESRMAEFIPLGRALLDDMK